MFGPIGATELIVILVLALIIFGPGKLPEVGRAIGKSIREFKRATSAIEDDGNDGGKQSAGAGEKSEGSGEQSGPSSKSP